jgi:hypothetical protein
MDEQTKQIVGQAAGMMINVFFSYLEQQGISAEEADALFEREREKFLARHPSTLPPPEQEPLDI